MDCLPKKVAAVERWPLAYLTIIPQARKGSESIAMRLKAEWAFDSEAIRARGIIVFVKSN